MSPDTFRFTVEHVHIRKKFFMKKCQSIIFFAERKDKQLTYNKIEE